MILYCRSNELERTRVGITASRKVGNAVARNRARRLLREAARRLYGRIEDGWDIVLVARRSLVRANFAQVDAALRLMLDRAGVLQSDVDHLGTV
jgi:ribonuclease P protein component